MPAYFDHNATTALSPAAREAWLRAYDQHWHNASSLYREAGLTSQALEAAREQFADLLGVEPERVVSPKASTVEPVESEPVPEAAAPEVTPALALLRVVFTAPEP